MYIVRRGRRDDEGCVEGVKEMVGEIGRNPVKGLLSHVKDLSFNSESYNLKRKNLVIRLSS